MFREGKTITLIIVSELNPVNDRIELRIIDDVNYIFNIFIIYKFERRKGFPNFNIALIHFLHI